MTVLTEDIPDGTFGGPVPEQPAPDPNAARHVAELLDALNGWHLGNRARHPVTPHTPQTAAGGP